MQQQSTPGVLSPPQRRMFYGWWIVIVGCLQDAVKGGLFNTGFSLYFLPVLNELHLSRAATSLPFSLAKLESALIGPIAGHLIDRFDIRVMMALGTALAPDVPRSAGAALPGLAMNKTLPGSSRRQLDKVAWPALPPLLWRTWCRRELTCSPTN